MLDIICIGNAITDLLAEVPESFLAKHKLTKASMGLCDEEKQLAILNDLTNPFIVPGGSAANTANTLALLGIQTGFVGSVSNDVWGNHFIESLTSAGITSYVSKSHTNTPSGTSVIVITPDSERTMNTCLGSASDIFKVNIPIDQISSSKVLYIEGYAFDMEHEKEAVIHALNTAKKSSTLRAMTLSDMYCVERHKDDFINILENIDILFSNTDEYVTLFECDPPTKPSQIINTKYRLPEVTVITQSEKGATVIANGEIMSIPAKNDLQIHDLTGAGDQFAAGFLYGHLKGHSIEQSIKHGIDLASKVITLIGPRLNELDIKETINGANA